MPRVIVTPAKNIMINRLGWLIQLSDAKYILMGKINDYSLSFKLNLPDRPNKLRTIVFELIRNIREHFKFL